MRIALLATMVSLPLTAALVMVILTITYHRFRRSVPELRDEQDLQRLRSLAKLQMYLSLIAHPALTIGGVVMVWLIGKFVLDELDWVDLLLYGVLPIIIAVVVGCIGESPAEMAKTIPAPEASISSERDRVVAVWINRLFPTW